MTETPYQDYQSQTNFSTEPTDRPPFRQLRRSRSDRMLGGVCAGVANYLRVDPTLVRVGLAVLAIITWGVALLAYLAGWLLMPEE